MKLTKNYLKSLIKEQLASKETSKYNEFVNKKKYLIIKLNQLDLFLNGYVAGSKGVKVKLSPYLNYHQVKEEEKKDVLRLLSDITKIVKEL